MAPHALYVRNTSGFHLLPDKCGTHEATHVVKFTGRPSRRRTQNDRVIAMIEPLYFHDRLGTHRAGVVAGPLAKWSFVPLLAGNRLTLDNNLGSCRDRQLGVFANDYRHGRTLKAPYPIVFRNAARHFDTTGQIEQRVLAKRDRDFARLATREILLTHDAPLFTRGNIEAQRVAVLNHDAVSAEIDPTLVGLDGNID